MKTPYEYKNMSMTERCVRIRQIDEALHALFDERHRLSNDGLTMEQINRLSAMVLRDGKPHYA